MTDSLDNQHKTDDNIESVGGIDRQDAEDQTSAKQPKISKSCIYLIGILLISCVSLLAIVRRGLQLGLFFGDVSFVAGGYSVEDLIVTDELDSDGRPLVEESKADFFDPGIIYAFVTTSGRDSRIGVRWFYEDELIGDQFGETTENIYLVHATAQSIAGFPSGNYRAEVYLLPGGDAYESAEFTVEAAEVIVEPPQPTPEGHLEIENSGLFEVPFAFDETWLVDGQEWHISEVKIVILGELPVLAIVVDTTLDYGELSEQELKTTMEPIAQYAIDKGYFEEASELQINGEALSLGQSLYVTIVDSNAIGSGNRVPFKIDELN